MKKCMTRTAAALALAVATLAGGCFNIAVRVSPYTEIDQCYLATSMDWDMVSAPFRKDADALDTVQSDIAIPLLPVSIIDLPFEVVLDTLFLPYDYSVSRKEKKEGAK